MAVVLNPNAVAQVFALFHKAELFTILEPMFQVALLLLVFSATLEPAALPDLPDGVTISRFSIVADGIYRGGQPNERGFSFLKEHGVKTIINLRSEDDEGALVQKLGMNYFHIPIRLVFPWSKIPDSAIGKYFELVNNPDNYPIFFHCHRGADRTGALAAFFRIANQRWKAEKAWSEARDIGLHWWYRGLKGQVYQFFSGHGRLSNTMAQPATIVPETAR